MTWNLFLQNMNENRNRAGIRIQKRMLCFCVSILLVILPVCVLSSLISTSALAVGIMIISMTTGMNTDVYN